MLKPPPLGRMGFKKPANETARHPASYSLLASQK
jgi:hypothetical protein